jgi:hypothetical protein
VALATPSEAKFLAVRKKALPSRPKLVYKAGYDGVLRALKAWSDSARGCGGSLVQANLPHATAGTP